MAVTMLDTKEIANRLDTEPKVLRKFLRSKESPVDPVGKGHRYSIEARKFRTLKKAFQDWATSHTV